MEKIGKINGYTPLVKEEEYLQKESRNILRKMYQNSLKNFVTALYDGDGFTSQDIEELKTFIEEKSKDTQTK